MNHTLTEADKNLAQEFGADDLTYWIIFTPAQLAALLAKVREDERERLNDLLWDALQSDLEHGVKCLNDSASKKFHKEYPALQEFIAIMGA